MSRQAELNQVETRIRVVAGILTNQDGEILIASRVRSRSMKDRWEFPGGKLAAGESPETALNRELTEELGIRVVSVRHFQYIEHDYPDLNVAIDFFLVDEWQGEPRGCEGQKIRWVTVSRLGEQELLPADAPVIEKILSLRL
ncbi:MAG: 8-oxo-dGTP diphosphatase MutT [Gammaproteobacteria bacterium]|nr:8-oxo-dGTP diphosphatase MutT [Gammaproteobacteria bacterium]